MINPEDLTVISVMENDSGLGRMMVSSIKQFTIPAPSILVADRGRNGKLMKLLAAESSVVVINNQDKSKSTNTSTRHALGLNVLMSLVRTTYTAIVESDCVVLRKDWFDFDTQTHDLMASLKKEEYGEEQYHVCFMVFKTQLLNGMDWRPVKTIDSVRRDTGFRIFSHISGKTDKIEYLTLKACVSKQTKIFRRYFEHKSFEVYKDEGMPIAAHFGRGSDLSRRPNNGLGMPKQQKRRWAQIYHEFVKTKEIA